MIQFNILFMVVLLCFSPSSTSQNFTILIIQGRSGSHSVSHLCLPEWPFHWCKGVLVLLDLGSLSTREICLVHLLSNPHDCRSCIVQSWLFYYDQLHWPSYQNSINKLKCLRCFLKVYHFSYSFRPSSFPPRQQTCSRTVWICFGSDWFSSICRVFGST